VASCGSPSQFPRPLLSQYESATGNAIVRDCGYSVPLPGKPGMSLWLFCDTEITSQKGHTIDNLILGRGTAAEGTYRQGQPPGTLTELPTPASAAPAPAPGTALPGTPAPGPATPLPATGETTSPRSTTKAPQPFLPAPTGLTLPASTLPCTDGGGTYPARWFSGVARVPGSGNLLISFDDYCVTSNVFTAEDSGLVEYDPADNTLGSPSVVFEVQAGQQLPPQWTLGSPIFAGGYLYLYGYCPAHEGCGSGGVFLARTVAKPAWWDDAFTYQFWTGRDWSSDPASATSVLSHVSPLGIAVGDYTADGHGLAMIEETDLAGRFSIWQAATPTGPWRRTGDGQVPCTPGHPKDAADLCRALIGHPELSSANELLVSFFNPGNGNVELAAFGW
jgi:hypothetical protein